MPMCVLAIYKSICVCARAFVCVSYSLTSTMHAVVEQWQYRVKLLGCLPLTQFQCRIPMCVSTRINFAVLFVQGYFSLLLLLTSKCWNEANEKYALVITTSFHVQKPQHKCCSHIKFHPYICSTGQINLEKNRREERIHRKSLYRWQFHGVYSFNGHIKCNDESTTTPKGKHFYCFQLEWKRDFVGTIVFQPKCDMGEKHCSSHRIRME